MSGGEPSSIKRNVSCAAASLHAYVPDIFYFWRCAVMGFFEKLARFWAEFSPWLLVHIIIFCLAGGYFGYEILGAQGAAYYYTVIIIAIAAAAVFSVSAYLAFGRRDARYENNRLDHADRNRIYRCFKGSMAARLREAVIDMDVMSLAEALEKYKEIESEKNLSEEQRAVLSYYIGRCYQLMGYPSNGAKYFRDAIELGYDSDDAYLLASRCLVQNGSFDEAVENYNKLLEKGCVFDFIYTDIGIAYLKKGDGEKALEFFERSVNEGKNYAFALGGCSLAHLQLKDLEKSEEYYKKALTCNMNDVYGFKVFYCNIAESVGLIDEIDPGMKKNANSGSEIVR